MMSRRSADIYHDMITENLDGKGKGDTKKQAIDPITKSMIKDTWSFDPKIRKGNLLPLVLPSLLCCPWFV